MLISCQRQQNKHRLPWPQGVYWAEAKKESSSAVQKGVSRVFHSGLSTSAEASTFRNYVTWERDPTDFIIYINKKQLKMYTPKSHLQPGCLGAGGSGG